MRSLPRAAEASGVRRMTGGSRQRSSLAGSCMAFGLEGGVQRGGWRGAKRIQEVHFLISRTHMQSSLEVRAVRSWILLANLPQGGKPGWN